MIKENGYFCGSIQPNTTSYPRRWISSLDQLPFGTEPQTVEHEPVPGTTPNHRQRAKKYHPLIRYRERLLQTKSQYTELTGRTYLEKVKRMPGGWERHSRHFVGNVT